MAHGSPVFGVPKSHYAGGPLASLLWFLFETKTEMFIAFLKSFVQSKLARCAGAPQGCGRWHAEVETLA